MLPFRLLSLFAFVLIGAVEEFLDVTMVHFTDRKAAITGVR